MKTVFTTGEAAEICKVSQQTIIRCFDAGRLKGFRVPGSKFRRIPREALLAFMRANNIPADKLHSQRRTLQNPRRRRRPGDSGAVRRRPRPRRPLRRQESAKTGYEAGLLTSEFRPDLILLDYMLPDINGNVVCQAIKSQSQFANTRVVIVSGVVNQDEVDALLAAGADEFIKKPFDIDHLVTAGRVAAGGVGAAAAARWGRVRSGRSSWLKR